MAGLGDLGFKVFVDASGATQGANEYEQAAARVARATHAMAQAAKNSKAVVLQHAVSGRGGSEYRTMMKQIDAYKGLIDVTRKLAAAKRELQDVDIKQAAQDVHEAVKAMAQITKTTDYIGSPQLNKVKEMVEMYSRLATAARDLAKANRELEASQPKVAKATTPRPSDTGTATTNRERQMAIEKYKYQAGITKLNVTDKTATADAVVWSLRKEADAYKELVEAIGKADAAQEKRIINAGLDRGREHQLAREAEANQRLADAEREAAAASDRAHAFRINQIVGINQTIDANNRYVSALESTRFAAQDLRNYLSILAAGFTSMSVASVAAAASQERAFADVARTTQMSAQSSEMRALSDTYRQLSTQISTTYEDLSSIGSLGAQMGISADKLGDFTHAVAGFTTITGTSIDTATEAFGRFFEMVDNAGVEADHSSERYMNFASQVAELGAKSVATENEILTMANSIAASAASAGIGQDAILAYATAMASLGIKQEWARGSLQRIFGSINDAVAEAGEGMDKFATVLGMTTEEAENLWRTDPSTFFNNLLTSLNNVTDGVERWTVIKNLGFKNTRDIQLLQRLSLNIDLVNESFQNSADAARNTRFLDNSLETLNATLTETIARWKNSLANLGASLGGPFLAPIKLLLNGLIVIQNALSHLGDNAFGRIFTAAAGGVVIFGSLVAVSKVLQAVILNISASYVSMRSQMIEAGLSGRMTWVNIYKLIKQANMALYENIGLMRTRNALEKADQAASLGGAVASGSKQSADAIRAVGSAAAGAGENMGKLRAAAAGFTTQTGILGKALDGLKGIMGGIASIGPMGWIGIAATAIPIAIQLYNEWANAEQRAAEKAREVQKAQVDALGGADRFSEALLQDSRDAAAGNTNAYTGMMVAVDGSAEATRKGADALYYWIDASGNLVQATKDQAQAMGYSTLAIGEHTAALFKDALANSDAFKDFTNYDFQWLKDAGFDWKEWARIQAEEGKAGIDSYIDTLINELKAKGDELEKQFFQQDSSPLGSAGRLLGGNPGWWTNSDAEEQVNQIEAQIEALQKLKSAQGDIADTASTALSSQQALSDVTQGLTGDTQDAADAQGNLADATADAAEDAKTAGQAWDEYLQALDAVIDAAFAFTNAEADMYSSLDALNQSLYENGNTFETFTEAGRSNLEALQNYLKATAQYAGRMAEEMGMSGAEAQEYIAEYVQAAIDDLRAQGVDTSWVDDQINAVSSSLSQTIQGPTIDMSSMNAGLQDAVNNANQAAALIQQILGGVGIRTSSRPGGNLGITSTAVQGMQLGAAARRGGFGPALSKTTAAGLAGSVFAGRSRGAGRSRAANDFATARGRYQFTPKQTSSGRGGGGGGGGGNRGGGGGGGGGGDRDYTPRSHSSRTKKEKTPEEIFEDFLSRLDKAMTSALDKFWKNQDAQDKYHAQINSMRKTIEDAKKSIEDLGNEIWDLNNTLAEKQNDLANQKYFQSVARKYGDNSRVRDIQVDIDKTSKEIADTQKSIAEKTKEINKTKEGMYALQGYTEAAINNRAALKALQATMIEMINAYAASGASTEQLTAYTAQLKQEFITQATQMGFNQNEVTTLSGAFDNLTRTIQAVPRVVDVDVSDDGTSDRTGSRIRSMASNGGAGYSAPVTAEADTWRAGKQLSDLARDRTANVFVNVVRTGAIAGMVGGLLGRAHGGRVPGLAGGGGVVGGYRRHGNWDADDLLGISPRGGVVGIQSGEYVIPRSSVDKYGPGMMESIRAGQYRPEVKVNNGPGLSGPITINPNQINQLARAVSTVLKLDGRTVGAAVNNVNAASGRRGTY